MQKCSFSPGGVLSKQSFIFPNNRSAKCVFAAWAGKPAFLLVSFLKNKNKTAEKIAGQCCPVKSKVTCKNSAHLDEAKKPAKKSLYRLEMQAPLQLKSLYHKKSAETCL